MQERKGSGDTGGINGCAEEKIAGNGDDKRRLLRIDSRSDIEADAPSVVVLWRGVES